MELRPLPNTAQPAEYSAARRFTRQIIPWDNDKSCGETTPDDNGELPPTTDNDYDDDNDDDKDKKRSG